jgi:hypothetical protein
MEEKKKKKKKKRSQEEGKTVMGRKKADEKVLVENR